MNLRYFKRFRMQIDLPGRDLSQDGPPQGYQFLPWDAGLTDAFAEAKFLSFRNEIDANVFPCLGNLAGCRRLMGEITRKPGFLPGTTWLIAFSPPQGGKTEYCGTIQGIRDRAGLGSIQNVGITPPHRDRGLGTCLLYHSLRGFREAGLRKVYLEVTAENVGAIRLYQRLGFDTVKTVYKAVEMAFC